MANEERSAGLDRRADRDEAPQPTSALHPLPYRIQLSPVLRDDPSNLRVDILHPLAVEVGFVLSSQFKYNLYLDF